MHLEFASDGRAETLVGRFDAMEQEQTALIVAQITQAREFVGESRVLRIFGHSRQDIGGVAHALA
jgi:hypothetical protein